jgi:glucokinase
VFNSSNKLTEDEPYLIGVDVGGTNLRVAVVNKGRVVWEQRVKADFAAFCRDRTPEQSLDFILDTLSGAIQEARVRHRQVSAVGIGFPGFIDPISQCVSQSPNLPGLYNINLVTPLTKALGVPVVVENDALAAAYGEYFASAGYTGSMVYLGLGTGVGGGAVLDGKIYPGSHGVAMEVGHLIIEPGGRLCGCGNLGCLEQYASASGVQLTYAELTGDGGLDAEIVAALAREGDAQAIAAYRLAGESLAKGLACILKVLDVPRVVIGGGMSGSWSLMKEAFDARLEADLIPALRGRVDVRISQSGDQAGVVGAAMLALAHQHGIPTQS